MIAEQDGQGPSIPAMDTGTRSFTPHFGQLKERRSWPKDIPRVQVKE